MMSPSYLAASALAPMLFLCAATSAQAQCNFSIAQTAGSKDSSLTVTFDVQSCKKRYAGDDKPLFKACLKKHGQIFKGICRGGEALSGPEGAKMGQVVYNGLHRNTKYKVLGFYARGKANQLKFKRYKKVGKAQNLKTAMKAQ